MLSRISARSLLVFSTRSFAVEASAANVQRFGPPSTAVSVEKASVDDNLKDSEILLRMLAAPVSIVDLSKVKGFGSSQSVPFVGGNEGIAVVDKVGSGVKNLQPNDVVVPAIPNLGTWRTHVVTKDDAVVKVADSPPTEMERAAAAIVAPGTALRLLDDFVELNKGDVVLQNNGGSTVAQCIVQLAAKRGVKTVTVVPDTHDNEEYCGHLKSLGATAVISEASAKRALPDILSGLPAVKLGLNSTGGASTRNLLASMGHGSTLVAFGGKPLEVPVAPLIEKGITIKGFNFEKYLSSLSAEKRQEFLRSVYDLTAKDGLVQLLAREPFSEFNKALERAEDIFQRKVVVTF